MDDGVPVHMISKASPPWGVCDTTWDAIYQGPAMLMQEAKKRPTLVCLRLASPTRLAATDFEARTSNAIRTSFMDCADWMDPALLAADAARTFWAARPRDMDD